MTNKPANISFRAVASTLGSLETMLTGEGENEVGAGLLDETLTMPLAHKGLLMSFMRILL